MQQIEFLPDHVSDRNLQVIIYLLRLISHCLVVANRFHQGVGDRRAGLNYG